MSDYMFMLENHLNSEQARFVSTLQAACDAAGINVFLAGGAMRDMLGGFPVRDLDFVIEANPAKTVKHLVEATGAQITGADDARKITEFLLPGGSTISVGMVKSERYAKPGGKPHISPATIHEDLRCRDLTVNAIALSIGRASRGLLLDPTNGLADLERRELRAVNNTVLYNDPVRLWRLVRLRVRLGFTVEERTQSQYQNARDAGMEGMIQPRALFEQLRQTAIEPNPAEVLKALDEEKLLARISPALTGSKLNWQGFAKLQKARLLIPFGLPFPINEFALFLYLLTEKLTPKERAAAMKAIAAEKAEADLPARLEARAKKLETALKSEKMQKPSLIHALLAKEPGEVILFLYMRTGARVVQDRIRNYLQKYLPAAAEVTDAEIESEGLKPGTPKFTKRKAEKVAQRLDGRPRKPSVAGAPMVSAMASRR